MVNQTVIPHKIIQKKEYKWIVHLRKKLHFDNNLSYTAGSRCSNRRISKLLYYSSFAYSHF